MSAPHTFGWAIVTEIDDENPVLGDLLVRKRKFVRLSTLTDRVRQAIEIRLAWWRGEWFLDTRRGVPYVEELFGKGVSLDTIREVLRREIESIDGVARVASIRVDRDPATRHSTVDLHAITTEGEPVELDGASLGGG